MNTNDRIDRALARLSDEDFAMRDQAAVANLPLLALDSGFIGLALAAPRQADATEGAPLRGLALVGRSARREVALPWQKNAILVGTELTSGTVHAGPVFIGDDSKRPLPAPATAPAPPPAPSADEPDETFAGTQWLDFRRLLALPAAPGQWAWRLINFDQLSNPAYTAVGTVVSPRGAAGLTARDALEVVERLRASAKDGAISPEFERSSATPVLTEPGAAIALGRPTVEAGAVRSLPLHGALRLEISPHMIVRFDGANRGVPAPTLVLRAMVLVVLMNHSTPIRVALEIPVWPAKGVRAGQTIDAAFTIDIAPALPAELTAGLCQVYLAADRYVSAPATLTVKARP